MDTDEFLALLKELGMGLHEEFRTQSACLRRCSIFNARRKVYPVAEQAFIVKARYLYLFVYQSGAYRIVSTGQGVISLDTEPQLEVLLNRLQSFYQ